MGGGGGGKFEGALLLHGAKKRGGGGEGERKGLSISPSLLAHLSTDYQRRERGRGRGKKPWKIRACS